MTSYRFSGTPHRFSIYSTGDSTSEQPYFAPFPGLVAFIDVFEHPKQGWIEIAFVNVESQHEGQGYARQLIQHVYDTFPESHIFWGRSMDDRIDHLRDMFRRQYPDRTSKRSNIFDPVQKTLDPKVFDRTDVPRPRVVKFIENELHKAMVKELGFDASEFFDIYLTGSITTYQYSEISDIDLSVFVQWEMMPPHISRHMLVAVMVDRVDGSILPGTEHPIQHFIMPKGTLREDVFKPGLRSAWSFREHEWIVPPERARAHDIQTEMAGAYLRASLSADKLRELLDYNPIYAREYWHFLHKWRQESERRGEGDFSDANLAYKLALHEGLFDRLRDELGEKISRTGGRDEVEGLQAEEVEPWQGSQNHPEASQDLQAAEGHVSGNESEEYVWPSFDDVHDASLSAVDNHQGYRDPGLIEGAVGNTQMQQMYGQHEDIYETAAHLLAKIQRQQAIVEGNKRTATATAIGFLENNGIDVSELGEDGIFEQLVDIIYHISDPVEDEDKYIPMLAQFFRDHTHPGADPEEGPYPWEDEDVDRESKLAQDALRWDSLDDVPQGGEVTGPSLDQDTGWEEEPSKSSEPLKVIYQQSKDLIILGTQNEAARLPEAAIIGEYDESTGVITLQDNYEQWLNMKYFKRLWIHSFPKRPFSQVKVMTNA